MITFQCNVFPLQTFSLYGFLFNFIYNLWCNQLLATDLSRLPAEKFVLVSVIYFESPITTKLFFFFLRTNWFVPIIDKLAIKMPIQIQTYTFFSDTHTQRDAYLSKGIHKVIKTDKKSFKSKEKRYKKNRNTDSSQSVSHTRLKRIAIEVHCCMVLSKLVSKLFLCLYIRVCLYLLKNNVIIEKLKRKNMINVMHHMWGRYLRLEFVIFPVVQWSFLDANVGLVGISVIFHF